jgi:hypothetical protein
MTGFLSEEELAALTRAELLPHETPIPTQVVSSDEFVPDPQNEKQREVEARLLAMADELGPKQGLDRRGFFRSAAGMAASFVAMNEVYGPIFAASQAEAATPAMAQERADALKGQFIMDMHTHFLRDDTRIMNFVAMRTAVGKAGWNKQLAGAVGHPAGLVPDQRADGAGARAGQQGGRPQATLRAHDLHARAARLARRGGCRPRAQARLGQGLHDRRQHPQGAQQISLAPR